jgi:O-methyltransferase involved in polyketide biosynthesis
VTGTAICATAGHTNPAAHPGAVVLDLGCGLESRVFRVDRRPATTGTTWTFRT